MLQVRFILVTQFYIQVPKRLDLAKQISKTICIEVIAKAMKLNKADLKKRIKRKDSLVEHIYLRGNGKT